MSTTPYAWKDWPEDCPECGGSLQVFTDDPREGWATDGDTVRCADSECGVTGHISAEAEDNCYAMFPDLDPWGMHQTDPTPPLPHG